MKKYALLVCLVLVVKIFSFFADVQGLELSNASKDITTWLIGKKFIDMKQNISSQFVYITVIAEDGK